MTAADAGTAPLPPYVGSRFEARNEELLAALPNEPGPEAFKFIARHPQMVDSYVLLGLLSKIPTSRRTPENPQYLKIAFLQWLRGRLTDEIDRYPVGRGPVERIWQEAVDRQISPRFALAQMEDDSHVWSLSWPYVRALSRHAYLKVQFAETIRDGWLLQEMVLRTTEVAARPNSDIGEVRDALNSLLPTLWSEAAVEWLLAAAEMLNWSADGRLYRRAEEIGGQVIASARANGDTEVLGRALHRLATVNLDPYKGLRGLEDRLGVRDAMRRRLEATLGPADRDAVDWALADMPTPSDALTNARSRYREAAKYRSGTNKALSLKGFFEATRALQALGHEVDLDEAQSAATEAISLFDVQADRHHILSLEADLKNSRPPRPQPQTQPQRGRSWLNRRPDSLNYEAHVAAAAVQAQTDPVGALTALAQYHDEARTVGVTSLVNLWSRELALLAATASDTRVRIKLTAPRSVLKLGRLYIAAEQLRQGDREAEALELLGRPVTLPPELRSLEQAIDYHRMRLHIGAAVNAVAEHPAASVGNYADALSLALVLGLEGETADLLRRIGWLARDAPTTAVALRAARQLLPLASTIATLGPVAQFEFFRCCQFAFTAGALSGMPEQDALNLRQMIKGWSFARALEHGARYDIAADPEGQQQLALIDQARAGEGSQTAEKALAGTFDADRLLTTYISDREIHDGSTASERWQNMERVFDQRVFNPITRGGGLTPALATVAGIQECLDDDTVMLDILLGCHPSGSLVVYTWVYTRADSFVIASHTGDIAGSVDWSGDGAQLLRHPLADLVDETRRAIAAFPGPTRLLPRQASELLAKLVDVVFGGSDGLSDIVKLSGQGKKHLIIVPHGPLHYLPFHLLSVDERVIQELFRVRALPNLALLAPAAPPSRQLPLQAFAMSFQDREPFGLQPIEASVQEAQDIAASFQARPQIDAEATEEQFRHALQEARRVHISTHGENVTSGGAFHRLYLWPTPTSDGKLHAYELLDLDLHGLELLSTSACETGLGRFDLLDNLRGLPAAFLLRGTRTLVTTLWPVEVDAARLFFTSMYEHISTEASSTTAAFAYAQAATRRTYPQYYNWGPFYMIGAG